MSKKETYKAGSVSQLVSFAAHTRLKNIFAVLNATRILLRGGLNQKCFFFFLNKNHPI